jgi:hypothetical protein
MNLIFGFIGLVAAVFVVGKIFTRAPQTEAPLTCPAVPVTTLSDEVKAFMEARLRAQTSSGSMSDLIARLEKMQKLLMEARALDADAKELGDKISEFEKFTAQQRSSSEEFLKTHTKGEFIRLGNAMTLLCRPKGAEPPPPRLPIKAPAPAAPALPPAAAPPVAPAPAAQPTEEKKQ